jgi:hypothetical protein
MATIRQAREAVYGAFRTAWANKSALTFDNENFSPPVKAPWVRFSMLHQDGVQESLGPVGNRRYLRSGTVIIQIFVPLNSALFVADGLVQDAKVILEGTTLLSTALRFYNAVAREIGESEGWYQFNLEVEFEYQEIR